VIHYKDNPVQRVCSGGETLRRRLDGVEATLDFAVLTELKAHGATDYLALPIRSIHGRNRNYMLTYVTDRPSGFTPDEIADITRVSQRVAVLCDIHGQRWIAANVLNAYLGPKTGPRLLAGQIRRGTGEELRVVLWSSDLRSSLSDRTGCRAIG
jgi:adenylate cyclase